MRVFRSSGPHSISAAKLDLIDFKPFRQARIDPVVSIIRFKEQIEAQGVIASEQRALAAAVNDLDAIAIE